MKQINYKTFSRQHDQSDCGIACLLSIISYYKGKKSLEELRELSGTTKQGTTLLGLYQASQKCNFNTEGIETTTKWLKSINEPVILHVIIDKRLQHYIICYGFKNNHFIIGDPAKGIVEYTAEELSEIWQSKALLKLNPNADFEKVESIKKEKIKWFKQLIIDDLNFLSIVFVLSLVISILGVSMAIYSQKLIDDILPSHDIEKLIVGTVLLLILLIARGGINYLAGFFGITQSKNFNNRLINNFYNSLLFLPKSFFDNRRIGELVARMDDTSQIQTAISKVVGILLKDFLMLIVGLVVLFTYSTTIGLILVLSIPLFAIISYRYHKNIVKSQQGVMGANAHKSGNYVNTMQGIDSIKSNKKEKDFARINQVIYGHYQEKLFQLGKLGISLQMSAEILGVVISITILGTGSWLVITDVITTGSLMAILGISGSIFPGITSLAFANITLQGAKVAFDRMFEFTSIKPEYEQTKNENNKFQFESLIIQDLSFRFPGRKQILSSINLSLKKGGVIAILGESGGGKSTLLNILQGFYKPEVGVIEYNSKYIEDIYLPELRNELGIVPQDIAIFNGNLLDNLTMGGDEKLMKECVEYCQQTGFDQYFSKFPQNYGTLLGEEGINLSGGQKQLIGLCRALFKKPSLLLLDEPTSAMDRNTENFALSLINKSKSTCGVIIVTHQLKIANTADTIYILKDGEIQAVGNQSELLSSDNLYSQIYNDITNFSVITK